MSFTRRVIKRHKKAAKWGIKAHKKAFKIGKKVNKYANPITGPSNLLGKVIGGKAGKIIGRGGAAAATGGMSEAVRFVKKLFKKKDTNVRVSGKQKRREKLDARKGAPSAKVVARRANKDAKDIERFADKDKARTRVNKQITTRNTNQDRSDTLYQSRAEIDADKAAAAGATAAPAAAAPVATARRATPRGRRPRQNLSAQARTRARLARRRARR
jgi:hypothetical protein